MLSSRVHMRAPAARYMQASKQQNSLAKAAAGAPTRGRSRAAAVVPRAETERGGGGGSGSSGGGGASSGTQSSRISAASAPPAEKATFMGAVDRMLAVSDGL